MENEARHECGLFGIFAPGKNVAWLTARGLDGQQTRGQEGAGIATTDGENFHILKDRGLVIQVFPRKEVVSELKGFAAIGHVRYSTTGRDSLANVQPLHVEGPNGEICLGHNGNLINAVSLRTELLEQGVKFKTTTDSEVIAQLLVRAPGKDWVERLRFVMNLIVGVYCLVILTKHSIILTKDPFGNRPLTIAKTDGYYAVASESGVFHNLPTEYLREVEPGEIIVFHEEAGMLSFPNSEVRQKGHCSFEWVYFMRPDSVFASQEAAKVRYEAGKLLAQNYPIEADFVVGVPRSGLYAADGFAHESGILSAHAIVFNQNKRVFLNPNQDEREAEYDIKYSTLKLIEGKRLVVVDDSIVRGNSTNRLIKLLRKAGVKEIHMRITFPPVVLPCYLGIDMATSGELIASSLGQGKSKEEIEHILAEFWEVDSVRFLSIEQLVQAIAVSEKDICLGCVGGRYAIELKERFNKGQFEEIRAN